MRAAAIVASALLLAVAPACALSPYDLFFRSEANAMLLGGGDMPGDLQGQPDLRRPTTLLQLERPVARLDVCSQTPLELTSAQGTRGRWRSHLVRAAWLSPLGEDERWALAVELGMVKDAIGSAGQDDALRAQIDGHSACVAAACRPAEGWRAGAAYSWGASEGSARGTTVAELLDLPEDAPRWPTIDVEDRALVLSLAEDDGPWQWAVLAGRSDPAATLMVRRARYDYSAPMEAGARWQEAWVGHRQGRVQWWALARDYHASGDGSIYLGAVGRGDVRFSADDRSLALGLRIEDRRATTQAQVDWRTSRFSTGLQGYAGLLPGISTDVHTLSAGARAHIGSIRLGHTRHLAGNWSWALSTSAHRAELGADAVIRRMSGLGSNPITEAEAHLTGGELRLWALTAGLVYADEHLRAILTGTAGLAQTNTALEGFLDGEDGDGADGAGRRLRVRPLITSSLEWRF
ncbi:MAG: hypothetical protein AB7Y46_09470 [Armatimonadota bacterium]